MRDDRTRAQQRDRKEGRDIMLYLLPTMVIPFPSHNIIPESSEMDRSEFLRI